jgi:hypothetical protein
MVSPNSAIAIPLNMVVDRVAPAFEGLGGAGHDCITHFGAVCREHSVISEAFQRRTVAKTQRPLPEPSDEAEGQLKLACHNFKEMNGLGKLENAYAAMALANGTERFRQ